MQRSGAKRSLSSTGVARWATGIGILLTVIVLSAAAHAAIPNSRALKTRDEVLQQKFESAVDLYLDGQYQQARGIFRDLTTHPYLSERGHEVVAFMIGKCLWQEQEYKLCRDAFDKFIADYPGSPYVAAADIYVGHCQFKTGDNLQAVYAYAAALDASPTDEEAAIARQNAEPLVRWSLSSSDLEYLLTNLKPGTGTDWLHVWIADRWMAEGRVRLATDLYHEVIDRSRRSGPGRLASERLKTRDDLVQQNRITVGILAPLTGEFEHYGRDMAWAADMAAESLVDASVELHLFDTRGDSSRAVQLVDSLVAVRCQVVIGPLLPEAIQGTLAPLAKEHMVQILPLARREGYTAGMDYVFQMSSSPGEQAQFLADYATRVMNGERVCALVSDSPEGREAATSFVSTAKQNGATVYPVQYFEEGDTDFGEQLRLLKRVSAPPGSDTLDEEDVIPVMDGMLIWGDPDDLILIVPQIVFHRFHVFTYGPAAWGDPAIRRRIHSTLDSTFFISYEWVNPTRLAWLAFDRSFREQWGQAPSSLAGRVYDLTRWLAVVATQDTSPRHIVEQLTKSAGYDGVTGHWRFNQSHTPDAMPLLRYENGEPAPVTVP